HRPLAILAGGFVVEIVERERDVFRHPLQQRDYLLTERARLALGDEEYADTLAVAGERHRRRGADMALGNALAPGKRAHVVQIVVADGHLAVAKGLPADTRAFSRAGIGRDFDVAQPD